MGAVLAKFRKEKSSGDRLEKLETEIRKIEKFSLSTQRKKKRIVGNLLVISIGLYAISFIIFYFVYFPPTWQERITYSVPLLLFPMIIFLLRRLLAWYFQRKLNRNSTKLIELKAEKKRILEEVMEKETYNVASKLLSKYGSNSFGSKPFTVAAPTPQPNRLSLDNRVQSLTLASTAPLGGQLQLPNKLELARSELSVNNNQPAISPMTPRTPFNPNPSLGLRHRATPTQFAGTVAVQQPRPYPIIDQKSQSILEKMVDYLIGDGPQNRYALICKECFSHNGMARQEEFEYATFRCAFCNALNPSRKSRPVAPKLPTFAASPLPYQTITSMARDSDSSSDSSDDSDVPRRRLRSKSELAAEDDSNDVNTNSKVLPNKESEKSQSTELNAEEQQTASGGNEVINENENGDAIKNENEDENKNENETETETETETKTDAIEKDEEIQESKP